MKKSFVLSVFLLFSASIFAQTRHIGINGGLILPYGNFGSSGEGHDHGHDHGGPKSGGPKHGGHSHSEDEHSDDHYGYAGIGFQTGLFYQYSRLNKLGYTVQFNYGSFTMAHKEELAKYVAEAFEVGRLSMTLYSGYNFFNILAGPNYTFGSDKIQFDASILVGFNSLTIPKFDAEIDENPETRFTRNAASAPGFTAQANFGARFKLTDKLGFSANLFNTFATTGKELSYENLKNPSDFLATKFETPLTFAGVSFGLTYQLK